MGYDLYPGARLKGAELRGRPDDFERMPDT